MTIDKLLKDGYIQVQPVYNIRYNTLKIEHLELYGPVLEKTILFEGNRYTFTYTKVGEEWYLQTPDNMSFPLAAAYLQHCVFCSKQSKI